ncbi:MAG TPA: MFS transporter, partial [Pararhizobium sp.]|nr:MFS transporter [Pararhizobium sp.]
MKAISTNRQIASDAAADRPAYGTISLLGWAHFLNDGAANYLPGILPAILVSLDLSVSLAGTLMAALLVGQALQPLTGLLSDRIGGRGFTITGLAFTSIAGAMVAFTPNVATLAAALIVLGVANGVFHPQTLAAVRRASGPRAGTGLSIFLIGGEIGRGIWPLAASLLVTAGGIGSIWILGLPGILTLALLWRRAPGVPPRPAGAARVRWGLHLRPLGLLVLFASLRGVLLYAISTFVPILWHDRGGSLVGGAGLITTLMMVGIIGNLMGGRLADSGHRRPIIGAAM